MREFIMCEQGIEKGLKERVQTEVSKGSGTRKKRENKLNELNKANIWG